MNNRLVGSPSRADFIDFIDSHALCVSVVNYDSFDEIIVSCFTCVAQAPVHLRAIRAYFFVRRCV